LILHKKCRLSQRGKKEYLILGGNLLRKRRWSPLSTRKKRRGVCLRKRAIRGAVQAIGVTGENRLTGRLQGERRRRTTREKEDKSNSISVKGSVSEKNSLKASLNREKVPQERETPIFVGEKSTSEKRGGTRGGAKRAPENYCECRENVVL